MKAGGEEGRIVVMSEIIPIVRKLLVDKNVQVQEALPDSFFGTTHHWNGCFSHLDSSLSPRIICENIRDVEHERAGGRHLHVDLWPPGR